MASKTTTPPCIPAAASWPVAPFLPIMPQWEQVNGGRPKAGEPVFFLSLSFLGEQRATATRLSGFSNMAPARHHMGWLAGRPAVLCVCVCF